MIILEVPAAAGKMRPAATPPAMLHHPAGASNDENAAMQLRQA
jgi:hypothetical protein